MSLGSLHSILHNETMALDGEVMFNFFKDLVSGMRFLHAHEPPLIHAGTANLLAQVHIMDSSQSALQTSSHTTAWSTTSTA